MKRMKDEGGRMKGRKNRFAARGHGAAGDPPTGVGREPGYPMKHPRAATPFQETWPLHHPGLPPGRGWKWDMQLGKWTRSEVCEAGIRSDLAETVAVCGPVVPSPYCFTPESRLRHLGEHLARALRMCAGLSAGASAARHEALLAWEEERYGSRKGAKGAKGGA